MDDWVRIDDEDREARRRRDDDDRAASVAADLDYIYGSTESSGGSSDSIFSRWGDVLRGFN